MDKKNRINDDMLENVNGGYLFYSKGIGGADEKNPWEIIDKNGDVVGRFGDSEEEYNRACKAAEKMGLDTTVIGWDELCRIRKDHGR